MNTADQAHSLRNFGLEKISEAGSGRAFVLIFEENNLSSYAQSLFEVLSERTRVLLLKSELISSENWDTLTDSLCSILVQHNLRQASFVGFGAASILVQNLGLRDIKLVRTLTLIDASCRPHAGALSRLFDWAERGLPMGLPFRHRDKGFYSRPFLQRLRCPTLVVNTSRADGMLAEQSEILLNALPTAWHFKMQAENEASALRDLLLEFESVPAKRPQKNKL